MTTRSIAWVCGLLIARAAGSDPAEGFNFPLLCLLCVGVSSDLCDELSALSEESYRVCMCVCLCVGGWVYVCVGVCGCMFECEGVCEGVWARVCVWVYLFILLAACSIISSNTTCLAQSFTNCVDININ
jgi:hypothetical protein